MAKKQGKVFNFCQPTFLTPSVSGKVVVHSIPPYAMAWTSQHICVAGPDKKVVFYTPEGMLAQQFDYFR